MVKDTVMFIHRYHWDIFIVLGSTFSIQVAEQTRDLEKPFWSEPKQLIVLWWIIPAETDQVFSYHTTDSSGTFYHCNINCHQYQE